MKKIGAGRRKHGPHVKTCGGESTWDGAVEGALSDFLSEKALCVPVSIFLPSFPLF